MKFTIVRANKPGGGYQCNMSVAWRQTGYNFTTIHLNNPGVHLVKFIVNSAGGDVLPPWDLGNIHVQCNEQNTPYVFYRDFTPDVYDIIAPGSINIDPADFYRC